MRYAMNFCEQSFDEDKNQLIFTGKCIATKKEISIGVKAVEMYKYEVLGLSIQEAMPRLNKWEREFLISGISEEGWNLTFGKDEDDADH